MEDASRFVLRERKAGEALTVIPPPVPLAWDHMPREPHLLDYLIILRKHQWLILAFLVTVVTVTTIASFKMKPVYQATARVEVDQESQNDLQFQDPNSSYDEYVDMDSYIETQTKILESETLALQTINSLDLGHYPEFGGAPNAPNFARGSTTTKRPAILGAFLGSLQRQTRAQQPADRRHVRRRRRTVGCAGGQRARAELHRAELPEQVRRYDPGIDLAFGRA